jgi:hypothetical protein
MAFWPLRSSTPTMVNGASRMRTICPIGSTPGPNRFSAAVWPMTAFLAALAWSDCVNSAPADTAQLRMTKKSGVVPVICVFHVLVSEITGWLLLICGATARTEDSSVCMARRSSQVMVGCEPWPPRPPGPWLVPENNMTMLVPALSICARMRDLAPSPIDWMKMTAPTPMMMPRVVRNERILFRRSARCARRRVSPKEITKPPPSVAGARRRSPRRP